jgi:hypothetical protein
LWKAVVKTPSSLPPSTAATIKDATIGAVGLIPLPPLSMVTAIATVDNRHHHCHSVDGDNRQKPVVVVCH